MPLFDEVLHSSPNAGTKVHLNRAELLTGRLNVPIDDDGRYLLVSQFGQPRIGHTARHDQHAIHSPIDQGTNERLAAPEIVVGVAEETL